MLAAYCRLPRFLKGDRGLLLEPDAVPGGMLVDMLPLSAQRGLTEGEPSATDRRRDREDEEEERKRGGERYSIDAGSFRGVVAVGVRACVCARATCQ